MPVAGSIPLPKTVPDMDAQDVSNLLKFSEEVGNLKDVQRRGWVLKGIQNPESVAVSLSALSSDAS